MRKLPALDTGHVPSKRGEQEGTGEPTESPEILPWDLPSRSRSILPISVPAVVIGSLLPGLPSAMAPWARRDWALPLF